MKGKRVIPRFRSEAEEADWWPRNQDFILKRFQQAAAAGKLKRGTVSRLARERMQGASPTITIRIPETDLARARGMATKKGLHYQTYLKMLLHEALDREERKAG